MTTEKMTVHKALCELKTLDARIQKSGLPEVLQRQLQTVSMNSIRILMLRLNMQKV